MLQKDKLVETVLQNETCKADFNSKKNLYFWNIEVFCNNESRYRSSAFSVDACRGLEIDEGSFLRWLISVLWMQR